MFTCTPVDAPESEFHGCLCHSPAYARLNALVEQARVKISQSGELTQSEINNVIRAVRRDPRDGAGTHG